MKRFIGASILSVSMLGGVALASPAHQPGYFSLDTDLNYIVFKNQTKLEDGFMPSLGVSYNFDTRNSIGLNLGWIRSQWQGPYNKNINGGLYLLDYKRHFNVTSRYQPFVLAGIGYSHFKSPTQPTDLFNLNFGAGMDYMLTKRISARVVMKDIYTPKNDRHNGVFGVGMSYRFISNENSSKYQQPKYIPGYVVKKSCFKGKYLQKITIYFNNNSSRLTLNNKNKLNELAACFQQIHNDKKVYLIGYASWPGTVGYNDWIAKKRAKNVKNYLTAHHVKNIKIAAVGAHLAEKKNAYIDRRVVITQ